MATFNKINAFVSDIGSKIHNFSSDQLAVALTNTAPGAESILANLTQISYTNLSSRNITTTLWSQTSGTARLVVADLTLTASGAVSPFRYIYIYNDTASSKNLIGYYDYGSTITLASGDTFTIDFDQANGVFTIA
jgi:hypothetical protein